MGQTFYTADPHFGHARIVELANRPFGSIEEHDEHLISQINETVEERDRLIVLGDFCWKDPQSYRQRINAKQVWLIYGNHDKKSWGQCFSYAADTHVLEVGPSCDRSLPVFLSHYPHAYWPGSHRGHGHLYGHVHDAREETLDGKFPNRRSMDVGVDAAKRLLGAYRPFSETEIVDRLLAVPGHDQLDHYEAHDEHRKMYQVDSTGNVCVGSPSMETRPATRAEVFRWMATRGGGVPSRFGDAPRDT